MNGESLTIKQIYGSAVNSLTLINFKKMRTSISLAAITVTTLVSAIASANALAASATTTPIERGYMRKVDTYHDGARLGPRDPFTDGARQEKRDPFTDGARIRTIEQYGDTSRSLAGQDRTGVSADPARHPDSKA